MTWTVDAEIEQAISRLSLPGDKVRRCGNEEARSVQQRAMDVFVHGNPRSWWLALKHPFRSFPYHDADGFQFLDRHIPRGNDRCWFIAENEEDLRPVYDAQVGSIKEILRECPFFEYYLVGKNFDWLIIENDHNEVIVVDRSSEPRSE